MFRDQTIAGSWEALAARLDRAGELYRWAAAEPALSGIERVADLPAATSGADRVRTDEVMGALVRTAAVAGGGVGDAVLVVVHLLAPGLTRLARSIADLTGGGLDTVVAEACCRIRSFNVATRHRGFAAGLLLDTRKALLAELLVGRREVPWDTSGWDMPGPDESGDGVRLAEVLGWARARGVLAPADAAVLDAVGCTGRGGVTFTAAAARLGVSVRTVQRRTARATATLRAHAPKFLQETA